MNTSKHAAFESPREVLDRARDHTLDLEHRINDFFARKPYVELVEVDRETGQHIHKVRLTSRIPGKLAAITKDALQSLRDTLDHSVFASCVALGRSNATATKFPYADTGTEFEGELWALKEVSPVIRAAIEGFRPYQGGNNLLWALNKMRNTATHRMLVPVGAASLTSDILIDTAQFTGGTVFGTPKWNAATNEVEVLRVGAGSRFRMQVTVNFNVVFGDVPIVSSRPVEDVLRDMTKEVEQVLSKIETETMRLISTT